MPNIIPFASKETSLAHAVATKVAEVRAIAPLVLPAADAEIVDCYVRQIEGTYDSARAKTDTDHAIELLYIAYNTTPQAQGEIRNAISSIMSRLIDAQQASQRSVSDAVTQASLIDQKLRDSLPDWLDIKDSDNLQEIKAFVAEDLLRLAQLIEQKALRVKDSLMTTAKDYDAIITETERVTQKSEVLLSDTLEANAKLASDMRVAKATSKSLETLVDDMRKQVEQFQQLAADYQQQAQSAEQKASRANLLQTMFQVVSAIVPIVALVSGVGAPAVAAGAMVASVSRRVEDERNTSSAIKIREDRSRLQVKHKQLQDTIEQGESQVQSLKQERSQAGASADGQSAQGLDERIANAEQALSEAKRKNGRLEAEMNELETALGQLEQIAGNVGKEQESKAKSLRELQLEMVIKAEDYEKKRSEHDAELTKLKVLLAGQRDEQETNELAIRSLNLSMTALKRTKEIVEEMAHFFMSFSAFMQQVVDEARIRVEGYEQVASSETLRQHKREQVFAATDEFFIEQTAQWLAVARVCGIFAKTFESGWSKLNELNGNYINGEQLTAYLGEAAIKLAEIAKARETLKAQRLSDLGDYRKQIEAVADQALQTSS